MKVMAFTLAIALAGGVAWSVLAQDAAWTLICLVGQAVATVLWLVLEVGPPNKEDQT